MKKNVIILILVGVIVLLFFLTRGNKPGTHGKVNIVEFAKLPPREIQLNPTTYPTLHVLTKKEEVVKVDTFWKPAIIDSADVVRKYYETHVFDDSLRYDSTLRIFVQTFVRENRVLKNKWRIEYHPAVFMPMQHTSLKWRVLAGIGFAGNQQLFRMKVGAMLITAKGKGFGLAYYPLDKTIGVTMLWTIMKSKK